MTRTRWILAACLAVTACGRVADDGDAPAAEPAPVDEVRVIDDGRIHPAVSFFVAPEPGVSVFAVDRLDDASADLPLDVEPRVATSLDPTPHLADGVDSLVFRGHLVVPEEGLVTFTVDGPQDVVLKVHGTTLVHGERGRGAIGLAVGHHPYQLAWILPEDGEPRLDVTWEGPGITPGPIPPEALTR